MSDHLFQACSSIILHQQRIVGILDLHRLVLWTWTSPPTSDSHVYTHPQNRLRIWLAGFLSIPQFLASFTSRMFAESDEAYLAGLWHAYHGMFNLLSWEFSANLLLQILYGCGLRRLSWMARRRFDGGHYSEPLMSGGRGTLRYGARRPTSNSAVSGITGNSLNNLQLPRQQFLRLDATTGKLLQMA